MWTLSRAKVSGTGGITVACTKDAGYAISLDQGKGNGTSTSSRNMSGLGGSDRLKYDLYRDSAYTLRWGTSGERYTGTGSGFDQSLTVYGSVPSGQAVKSGSYRDTVTATVSFEGCC